MKNNQLDPSFWKQRYTDQDTPWDIGQVSPAIQHYIDGLNDKSLRILIPGAGKSHEAIYLHQQGFKNVFVCDWVHAAFELIEKEAPDFPKDHLLVSDFFQLDIAVDLILEQTFFCAIDPDLRTSYVKKTHELLKNRGKLVGLLFAKPFPFQGPPFGGTKEAYTVLFSTLFEVLEMEVSNRSISPRAGNELFIQLRAR